MRAIMRREDGAEDKDVKKYQSIAGKCYIYGNDKIVTYVNIAAKIVIEATRIVRLGVKQALHELKNVLQS